MPRRTYQPSGEKKFIRDNVDFALLRRLYDLSGDRLNYFGLPGADLEDIKSWRHLLGHVAGVERDRGNLRNMDANARMQMPDIRFTPHFGDIDVIILRSKGKKWQRGEQDYQPWVAIDKPPSKRFGWYFDVVNLDYFGPFLPQGQKSARQRADAIRKLFDIDRLDSWGRWVLLVTVEAQLVEGHLREEFTRYLDGVRLDTTEPAATIIDFLTSGSANGDQATVASRLIHGVAAALIHGSASHANLNALPRGTIMYRGSGGQPMIHLAYEFEPLQSRMPPPTPLVELLRTPMMTMGSASPPKLTLMDRQVPGLSKSDLERTYGFLGGTLVERLGTQLP